MSGFNFTYISHIWCHFYFVSHSILPHFCERKRNLMKKTSIHNILHFLVFFVILLWSCLTKFELIKLKYYFTTLLYAIAVNMLFLEFSSKRVSLLTKLSIPVRLNQYRGEIESFYNRSTIQITELTISLFNFLLNFTKNVLVYIILVVNIVF